ncbi:MAG: NERD domain-containing protein [Bacteroidales bacterium]|nr:NERD domain-containing protein [Bacteroidales bacterium]
MSQIIGQIDSLSNLKQKLKENGIKYFNSLDDIVSFRNDFPNMINKNKEEIEKSILSEIEQLKQDIYNLNSEHKNKLLIREKVLLKEKNEIDPLINHYSQNPKKIIDRIYYFYKRYTLKNRRNILFNSFEIEKKRPYFYIEKRIASKKKELQYKEQNIISIVEKRSNKKSKKILHIKSILDEYNTLFLGAIGEQKAVDELRNLPGSYIVINDFVKDFDPPKFDKRSGQIIERIQADHIVVGPSGVFLIETKNWSKNSIENRELHSPVEQIERTNYALFSYLNNAINYGNNIFFKHNWGSCKISVRNIILMINSKPDQEFQFVKILSLNEICNYITYFKPIFSNKQVRKLVKLLQHN